MHGRFPGLLLTLLGVPVASAGSFGGHVAATTDYVFRGVSQTRGDPAVQVDLHYQTTGGWFAGAWGSSVDLNPGEGATLELNFYGGRTWPLGGDWNARVTAVDYVYPNDDNYLRYDYFELTASLVWLDRVVASIAWSPNTSRFSPYYGGAVRDRRAWTYEVVGRWPVKGALAATASAGYYDLSDLFNTGYGYGSAGLSYGRDSWQLDVAYFLTNDQARDLFGTAIADDRWSVSASWRFP